MLGAFLNWADRLRPPDRSDPVLSVCSDRVSFLFRLYVAAKWIKDMYGPLINNTKE